MSDRNMLAKEIRNGFLPKIKNVKRLTGMIVIEMTFILSRGTYGKTKSSLKVCG